MDSTPISRRALQDFLLAHKLPAQFLDLLNHWYLPLGKSVWQHHISANRPLLVGINGSQGSGKSTLASLLKLLLTQIYHLNTIDLSIDDFYLTHESRGILADNEHPLLATRGVPGTHDSQLMLEVLKQLTQGQGDMLIPRFNKATDDRYPKEQWHRVAAPLDVVIVEGWCLGTSAQPEDALKVPVNDLEAMEDKDASWRSYVNQQIKGRYQDIYQMIDIWIMLQAPSFDCVYRWRLEQEEKLAQRPDCPDSKSGRQSDSIMSAEQIQRFIQHYQRLTEHSLKHLPEKVHYLYRLDRNRQIMSASQPVQVML